MIKQWHIFISGFTENRAQSTGLQLAWESAKTNKDVKHKEEKVFFPVLPWNHDWHSLARSIQINSITPENYYKPPLINIYAYSWGAGYGAIQLASSLLSAGNYEVQNMVLADPVYCSTNPLMRWRALFCDRVKFLRRFTPVITIPKNVGHVYWNRQYNNWPRAHALATALNSETIIHPPDLEPVNALGRIHEQMDEAPWFQNKVAELTKC